MNNHFKALYVNIIPIATAVLFII